MLVAVPPYGLVSRLSSSRCAGVSSTTPSVTRRAPGPSPISPALTVAGLATLGSLPPGRPGRRAGGLPARSIRLYPPGPRESFHRPATRAKGLVQGLHRGRGLPRRRPGQRPYLPSPQPLGLWPGAVLPQAGHLPHGRDGGQSRHHGTRARREQRESDERRVTRPCNTGEDGEAKRLLLATLTSGAGNIPGRFAVPPAVPGHQRFHRETVDQDGQGHHDQHELNEL